ncbi:hypothetical protein [Roseovarius aquimarinus]
MAERLRDLSCALAAAAEDGDLVAVSRIDHELRSAVIALVGAASLVDDGAEARLVILGEALGAVRAASVLLKAAADAQPAAPRGTLVYLDAVRRQRTEV